jgi:predicted transcriptional regulator
MMPVSKPMQLMAFRFSEEERETLERIARERNVTMTYVVKEGLRLYAQDARKWLDDRNEEVLTA